MAAAGRLMNAAGWPTTLDMGPGAGALGPERLRSTCLFVRMELINADVCFPSEKYIFLSPGLPGLVFLKRNINQKICLRKNESGESGSLLVRTGGPLAVLGTARSHSTPYGDSTRFEKLRPS